MVLVPVPREIVPNRGRPDAALSRIPTHSTTTPSQRNSALNYFVVAEPPLGTQRAAKPHSARDGQLRRSPARREPPELQYVPAER
jgi:hypothetical protein